MASKPIIYGSIATALTLSSSAYAQGLVSEKNISLAMAQTIANGAMEKCKEMGFKVSVVVIDRAGLPLVMLRGDGAGLHTPEGADRKAYTARTWRAPSAEFVKRMQTDPTSVGSIQYTRVLSLAGGLPIKVGDDVVGAVGVSGRPARTTIALKPGLTRWPPNSSDRTHWEGWKASTGGRRRGQTLTGRMVPMVLENEALKNDLKALLKQHGPKKLFEQLNSAAIEMANQARVDKAPDREKLWRTVASLAYDAIKKVS